MKLPVFLLSCMGCSATVAVVNPFNELVCVNLPSVTTTANGITPTVPQPLSSSTQWVTSGDGLVTSCKLGGPNSTVWIFPTGYGRHEATQVIYEGANVITVTFVEVVVQIQGNQTMTTMSPDFASSLKPLMPTVAKTKSLSLSGLETPSKPSKTHLVNVGADGGLIFRPDQLTAAIGDTVRFNFLGVNHSVTQSSLVAPCTYNGGFDTGLNQFNPRNVSGLFSINLEVNTSAPLWFYCKQPGPPNHCGKAMVFAINPVDKFDEFLKNAEAQGKVMTILANIMGVIGTASSFGFKAISDGSFNSTIQRRYLR